MEFVLLKKLKKMNGMNDYIYQKKELIFIVKKKIK